MQLVKDVSPVPDIRCGNPVQEERGRNEISNISCSGQATRKGKSPNGLQ